eukprot:614645-Pelagomonas_calceolata.AAC.3
MQALGAQQYVDPEKVRVCPLALGKGCECVFVGAYGCGCGHAWMWGKLKPVTFGGGKTFLSVKIKQAVLSWYF